MKRSSGLKRAVIALRGLVEGKMLEGLRPYAESKGSQIWSEGGKAADAGEGAVSDIQALGTMKRPERKEIYEQVQRRMMEILMQRVHHGRGKTLEVAEQRRELELMLREMQSASEE